MSELVTKAKKIAQAIEDGSRSKASPADIRKWSDEIFAAYQKNPDSPEVKECQKILFEPLMKMVPVLEVMLRIAS
jgi:hypothetical protein